MKRIFVDTMVFLHFRPIAEIPWHELAGGEPVTVIVSRVTVRELDKHKFNHRSGRIRERASRVIKELESLVSAGGFVKEGVELKFYGSFPSIDFREFGLHQDWADDVLLASALEALESDSSSEVLVLSDDAAVRLKASELGITPLEPPAGLRLPEDPDPLEKENLDLRRKLAVVENTLPSLGLVYVDGGAVTRFRVPNDDAFSPVPSSQEVHEKIRAREERLAYKMPQGVFAVFVAPAKDEPERYTKDLGKHLKRYADYLVRLPEWERYRSRVFELAVKLVNSGSAPAEDIDIYLDFPGDFLVCEESDVLSKPREPKPPERPMSAAELTVKFFGRQQTLMTPSFLSKMTDLPSNVSGPTIRKTNSHRVEFSVGRVKHDFSIPLDHLFLDFSEVELGSFELKYWINAANMPQSVEGTLAVVFEDGDSS